MKSITELNHRHVFWQYWWYLAFVFLNSLHCRDLKLPNLYVYAIQVSSTSVNITITVTGSYIELACDNERYNYSSANCDSGIWFLTNTNIYTGYLGSGRAIQSVDIGYVYDLICHSFTRMIQMMWSCTTNKYSLFVNKEDMCYYTSFTDGLHALAKALIPI